PMTGESRRPGLEEDAATVPPGGIRVYGARPAPPEPLGKLPPVERSDAPTIAGVRFRQVVPTARVSGGKAEFPEGPGLRVVARPGRIAGNHFHLQRYEIILLVSGAI